MCTFSCIFITSRQLVGCRSSATTFTARFWTLLILSIGKAAARQAGRQASRQAGSQFQQHLQLQLCLWQKYNVASGIARTNRRDPKPLAIVIN